MRAALRRRERAEAAVALAVSVPLLVACLVLLAGVGQIVRAKMAVQATAYEAARACATAPSRDACLAGGLARAQEVASGFGLDVRRVEVVLDAGGFERGGQAVARARYPITLIAAGPLGPSVTAEAVHAEAIERYRSRVER